MRWSIQGLLAWDDQLTYLPIEEYLDTDGAKTFGWSIVEIVDWLLEADIYFILNHIHQGMNDIDCRSMHQYKSATSISPSWVSQRRTVVLSYFSAR